MADEGPIKNWVISFGPFRVIRARRIIERDGEAIRIGSRAFDVLACLLEHAGHLVSHRALLEAVWPGTNVEEGSLRFQIAMLRKALGSSDSSYVINVPGRGYCFTAPVSRLEEVERPTALAIAAASQFRQEFGDGVCFVELGRIEDPTCVRDALAAALGLPVRSADPFADIAGFPKGCRMLILMTADNEAV